ncbi:class I SAM-dependent methyltransferase [Patescibacteria group bacterium]|nr:class I SAM-dependent methyltransferase [Patescibacteria group bacterium]
MKNILEEKPSKKLHGRLLASVNFVDDYDLKNKDILDIGCGHGWCEMNFLDRGVKKMAAIEISENDLQTIRNNIKDERLRLKIGKSSRLPFPNNSFDTIVSWDVIEHIPKNTELHMFREASRVLKLGGCFYLSTPHKSFFTNILDPAWWLIGHRHYSLENLSEFAKDSEFQILEIKIGGRWWSLVSIIDLYISKWVFRRNTLFSDFLDKKEDEEFSSNGFAHIYMKLRKI